jgi:tetratricopeptide (TPR) repeat protein
MKEERLVKSLALGSSLILCLAALVPSRAEARNFHCSGGIQYVVQGMRDKDKGNTEDYLRQMGKAIQQLEICAAEDPKDFEALGYLGWAYAEIDSAAAAGKAFQNAIAGLEKANDKKKVEWARGNLQSYWAKAFNEGIAEIQKAQGRYENFCEEPKDDAAKAAKADAAKNYATATAALLKANALRPADTLTLRNLGLVYAFQCDYNNAETYLNAALKVDPGNQAAQEALRNVRANSASRLQGDAAVARYDELIKQEPNNPDHYQGLGSVLFDLGQTQKDEEQKKTFGRSADAYAKAFSLKPDNVDFAFNAGLAYQNARMWDKAVPMWQSVTKLRPTDADAWSSLAASLVEMKKCDESVAAAHKALEIKSEEKNLHRQLGAIYTKCNNQPKATEELMIFLALDKGQAVADPAAHAKSATGQAAKTLAAEGAPEQIVPWSADQQKYETWFYWKKKTAFTFNTGTLVTKSDWSSAGTAK